MVEIGLRVTPTPGRGESFKELLKQYVTSCPVMNSWIFVHISSRCYTSDKMLSLPYSIISGTYII